MNKLHLEQIRACVLEGPQQYAGGIVPLEKLADGRKILRIDTKDFLLTDEFDGGNPYCGIERVIDKANGHVVWSGYYHGWIVQQSPSVETIKRLFDFLREALGHPTSQTLLRGPERFGSKLLHYSNNLEFGDFACFYGNEIIGDEHGEIVYYGRYGGGLVDLAEDTGEM